MRLRDWLRFIVDSEYTPTHDDELLVVVGGRRYHIDSVRVMWRAREDRPGAVAFVAGPEATERGMHAAPPETPPAPPAPDAPV